MSQNMNSMSKFGATFNLSYNLFYITAFCARGLQQKQQIDDECIQSYDKCVVFILLIYQCKNATLFSSYCFTSYLLSQKKGY